MLGITAIREKVGTGMLKIAQAFDPHAGRATVEFLDNRDQFIVGYPKSGNTWLRFLIGNILTYPNRVSFNNVDVEVPPFNIPRYWIRKPPPRIFHAHACFVPFFQKVLYIVRDPRSVAVSSFFYLKKERKIRDDTTFGDFLKAFVARDLFAESVTYGYGTWAENVGSWVAGKIGDQENFLIVRYERLLKDAVGELVDISRFLGLPSDEIKVRAAVKLSSFDEMGKLEKKEHETSPFLKSMSQEIPFVRAGNEYEWKEYFSVRELDLLWSRFGRTMELVGYDKDLPS